MCSYFGTFDFANFSRVSDVTISFARMLSQFHDELYFKDDVWTPKYFECCNFLNRMLKNSRMHFLTFGCMNEPSLVPFAQTVHKKVRNRYRLIYCHNAEFKAQV